MEKSPNDWSQECAVTKRKYVYGKRLPSRMHDTRYTMRHTNIAFVKSKSTYRQRKPEYGAGDFLFVYVEMMSAWLFRMFASSHITWTCYLIRNTCFFLVHNPNNIRVFRNANLKCVFTQESTPNTGSICLPVVPALYVDHCMCTVIYSRRMFTVCIALPALLIITTGKQLDPTRLMIVYQRLLPVLLNEHTQHYPSATKWMARNRWREGMQRKNFKSSFIELELLMPSKK